MKKLLWIFTLLPGALMAATCNGEYSQISAVQGSQSKSPIEHQEITVKGVVTGVFIDSGGLDGFFIQSQQADNDPLTSEGLFVHTGAWQPQLLSGDVIAVTGIVSERHDLTQLTRIKRIQRCQQRVAVPNATPITLPLESFNLEQLENMRVKLAQSQVITDVYQYLKFGELTVSSERIFSPTSLVGPGIATQQLNDVQQQDQLIIDDGRLQAYAQPWSVGADGQNPVAAENPMRMGYGVEATGVLNYAFGEYKLQPTEPLKIRPQTNRRSLKPDRPEGDLLLGTFNIENWFIDLDTGLDSCGLMTNMGCRGAKTVAEQQRQLAKYVTVLNAMDTAVVGLQEVQNNHNESLKVLVDALNKDAGFGKWKFIDAGMLGSDVIKVAFIYQPKEVSLQGQYAVLNRKTMAEYADNRNRVVLAQTFKHLASDNTFTMATVHLKSKGCRDSIGVDVDQKDGQGCYNATRKRAAEQISQWLKTDPTNQQAAMTFVVGDFNSYQKEDPITTFEEAGFHNLAKTFLGVENWTTSYRGKVGSLDYILANELGAQKATGVTQWHINSDEIRDFGYDLLLYGSDVKKPDTFFHVSPFASSDHDPVIAGFQLIEKP